MKTIRKAFLGMLFLAPLLLPVTTKAGGGFDEWIHDFFRHDHPTARPLPGGYGYDRGNPYRQYDPNHTGNSRRGDPLSDPTGAGNSVPLDGGLVFLAAAGLMLGVMKVYGQRRKMAEAPLG
jgi:hypothetical protein